MIRMPSALAQDHEYVLLLQRAQKALMTGPRSTPPRWSTIKRFLRTGGLSRARVNPLTLYRWGP